MHTAISGESMSPSRKGRKKTGQMKQKESVFLGCYNNSGAIVCLLFSGLFSNIFLFNPYHFHKSSYSADEKTMTREVK